MSINKKYRKFVGPSDFAVILGYDEQYKTLEDLRKEIECGYIPNDTYATQFGVEHEEIGIYYYQKMKHVTTTKPKFIVDYNNERIGGIADALVDDMKGLEIKCHIKEENLLTELPIKHLLQVTGYMYLYKRKKWDLMSCVFNDNNTIKKYTLFEVEWKNVEKRWTNEWYPSIVEFVDNVKWYKGI